MASRITYTLRGDDLHNIIQLAERGDVNNQLGLGSLYRREGAGERLEDPRSGELTRVREELEVEEDPVESARWFRRAAEAGNARGQLQLAECFYIGYGVTQDFAQAAEYYRKSAEQGHPVAQRCLGDMYVTGNGVRRQPVLAATWYQRATDQGDASAQYFVATAMV